MKKCKRFSNDFRSFSNVNVFERISNIFYEWPKFAKMFEDSKKGSEDVLTWEKYIQVYSIVNGISSHTLRAFHDDSFQSR